MAKSEPLRNRDDIQKIKNYLWRKGNLRDYTLFILGVNTALRIGDLLQLRWGDVMDAATGKFFNHVVLTEQKTKKQNSVMLNRSARNALKTLWDESPQVGFDSYIFQSRMKGNRPIHRTRAYSIIREAARESHIEGVICCHSMRKTFGYHAWKTGFPPAVIMEIYNHSSIEITKRYLSINQDDKDLVFSKLEL